MPLLLTKSSSLVLLNANFAVLAHMGRVCLDAVWNDPESNDLLLPKMFTTYKELVEHLKNVYQIEKTGRASK